MATKKTDKKTVSKKDSGLYGTDLSKIKSDKEFFDLVLQPVLTEEEYKQKIQESKIPTHILALDMLLSGGITEGDTIMFYAPSGLGKTTVCLQLCRSLMYHQNKKILYLDIEESSTNMLESNRMLPYVAAGQFFHTTKVKTIAAAEEMLLRIIKAPADSPYKYDVIVFDSITQLLDDSIFTRSVTDPLVGQQAKPLTAFMQKFKALFRENGITSIYINQERAKLNVATKYEKTTKVAGCSALFYNMDAVIEMRSGDKIVAKKQTVNGVEEVMLGKEVKIEANKNRKGYAGIRMIAPLLYKQGFCNIHFLTNLLINTQLISARGAYYDVDLLPGQAQTFQGKLRLLSWVKDNYFDILEIVKSRGYLELVREEKDEDTNNDENTET